MTDLDSTTETKPRDSKRQSHRSRSPRRHRHDRSNRTSDDKADDSTRRHRHHHHHRSDSRRSRSPHTQTRTHGHSSSGRSGRSGRSRSSKKSSDVGDKKTEAEAEKRALKDAIKSDSDSSQNEDGDGDESEDEWVIKADSGSYDYGQQLQSGTQPERPPVEHRQQQQQQQQSRPDISQLNKLKSDIMRAELQGDSLKAQALQLEYDKHTIPSHSTVTSSSSSSSIKVLDSIEIRHLHELQSHDPTASTNGKKGNDDVSYDMSIADMVREEKLLSSTTTKNNSQELDMARQIGKNSGYEGDPDYVFENAETLAQAHTVDGDTARRKVVERTRLLNTISDLCPLCIVDQDQDQDQEEEGGTTRRGPTKVKPISVGTRVYLCAAAEPALTKGVCVIVPMEHHRNSLECDDDEWEEIRNFMKCLVRMWAAYGRQVLFYENAVPSGTGSSNSGGAGTDKMHSVIYAVPVSADQFEASRPIFREAMETADEEWSTHRKVIDTMKVAMGKGGDAERFAFRMSVAKEAPYFHVWFNINGGLAHIVEDRGMWPKGDLFAREIVGNLIRTDLMVIRKRTRWTAEQPKFMSKWSEFDWTKQLD